MRKPSTILIHAHGKIGQITDGRAGDGFGGKCAYAVLLNTPGFRESKYYMMHEEICDIIAMNDVEEMTFKQIGQALKRKGL